MCRPAIEEMSMDTTRWTNAMQALVLVRIGQELGTDGPAARAIHDLLELFSAITGSLFR
jgi:hypothetical protein